MSWVACEIETPGGPPPGVFNFLDSATTFKPAAEKRFHRIFMRVLGRVPLRNKSRFTLPWLIPKLRFHTQSCLDARWLRLFHRDFERHATIFTRHHG